MRRGFQLDLTFGAHNEVEDEEGSEEGSERKLILEKMDNKSLGIIHTFSPWLAPATCESIAKKLGQEFPNWTISVQISAQKTVPFSSCETKLTMNPMFVPKVQREWQGPNSLKLIDVK